jgi:hypothetical protein
MAIVSVGLVVYWSCRSNGESEFCDFDEDTRTGGIDIQTGMKTSVSLSIIIEITFMDFMDPGTGNGSGANLAKVLILGSQICLHETRSQD